jgi:predicted DNA-binding transcriptional regulator YafY
MVAFCHLDSMEKSFRLDRIRRFDVVPTAPPEAAAVDCPIPSR